MNPILEEFYRTDISNKNEGINRLEEKGILCRGIASRRHLGTVFSCLMCPLRGSLSANDPSKESFSPACVPFLTKLL